VKTVFLASFLRDVRKIRDRRLLARIASAIEAVERVDSPDELAQFKWLTGHPRYGRIRVGDLRIGVIVDPSDTMTFVRCLHRREIYRFFP
jgi:mRNA interferase RelE/StbE